MVRNDNDNDNGGKRNDENWVSDALWVFSAANETQYALIKVLQPQLEDVNRVSDALLVL